MKRLLQGIFLLCLFLSACGKEPVARINAIRYIRTDGNTEKLRYPYTVVIRSSDELSAYIAANDTAYDFSCQAAIGIDSPSGFHDIVSQYNADYFQNGALILVVLAENSGSVRHEVVGVESAQNGSASYTLTIQRLISAEQTSDLAKWHIILEVPKNSPMICTDSIQIQLI